MRISQVHELSKNLNAQEQKYLMAVYVGTKDIEGNIAHE